MTVAALETLRERATKEPLDVDIADYSDEFCAGFLAGQVNAIDVLLEAALSRRDIDPCAFCNCKTDAECWRNHPPSSASDNEYLLSEALKDARSFIASIQRHEGNWENQAAGLLSRIDTTLERASHEAA